MNFELLAEADGLGIAVTGMVIVFTGLAGISLFIAALPKILAGLHGLATRSPSSATKKKATTGSGGGDDELAAIAYVIEAERQLMLVEDVRVMELPQASAWSFSDKMRTLPSRLKG